MGIQRCNHCSIPMDIRDLKRCSNCMATFYCSRQCQKLHWKATHKSDCVAPATKPPQNLNKDSQSKKVDRWINVWSPTIAEGLPVILDLANHKWGRHDTHAYVPSSLTGFSDLISMGSLVMTIEHTGLDNQDKPEEMFKAPDAVIKPCAEIIKAFPALAEHMAATNAPGLWPRIRCVFVVKDKHDPTKTERVRVHSRCVPNLRERFCTIDKDYSREASGYAVGALLCEINLTKRPKLAPGRMRWLVDDRDLFRATMAATKRGGPLALPDALEKFAMFDALDQQLLALSESRG